jgi:hypothetical protein
VLVQAAKQLSETELRHFTSQFLALSQLAARQDVTLPALMRNRWTNWSYRFSGRLPYACRVDRSRP